MVMTGLPIRFVEKPWGRERLPAPFSHTPFSKGGAEKRIGEIWFEPSPELPSLLVKYIFTSENLSVQVHPNDAQAKASGAGPSGKDECWLVIAAEPGAALGVGFGEPVEPDTMRKAALDGSIEDMLVWYPVSAGDFFYIPAGTVHAIGPGVSLIEIQQNSDLTYRLYDYGRPRDLHLDAGIAVAKGTPHDPALRQHIPLQGTVELARGPYFTAHRLDGEPDQVLKQEYARPMLVIPLEGSVTIDAGEIAAGGCGYASGIDAVTFSAGCRSVIVHPV